MQLWTIIVQLRDIYINVDNAHTVFHVHLLTCKCVSEPSWKAISVTKKILVTLFFILYGIAERNISTRIHPIRIHFNTTRVQARSRLVTLFFMVFQNVTCQPGSIQSRDILTLLESEQEATVLQWCGHLLMVVLDICVNASKQDQMCNVYPCICALHVYVSYLCSSHFINSDSGKCWF